MENQQMHLALLGRLDGPSVVPTNLIRQVKTYREAVRLCWALRRVHFMTFQQFAAEAELYAKHVSDYLAVDDAPGRRDLPGKAINRTEATLGNTAISQWLSLGSRLTVLEQMQADSRCSA